MADSFNEPVPIKGAWLIYGAMRFSFQSDQSGFWEWDWLIWASDFDELDYKLLE